MGKPGGWVSDQNRSGEFSQNRRNWSKANNESCCSRAPKLEKPPSDKLRPEFSLPSGDRLKRLALIGVAWAEAMNRPKAPSAQSPHSARLEQKVREAEAEHQKWSQVAADPDLSPGAAQVARNMERSSAAAAALGQKALRATRAQSSAARVPSIVEPKAGSFDGEPFFWTPSEAWAFSRGKWSEVNAADVGMNGVALSSEAFGKRFGKLPTLPQIAFSNRQRGQQHEVVNEPSPVLSQCLGAESTRAHNLAVVSFGVLDRILTWFANGWIVLFFVFNAISILSLLFLAPSFLDGFTEVRGIYGPFNVWNWAVEIALISPAFVALAWRDRRRKRITPHR
jgi:uncharacterized membrane protein